MNLIAYCRVSTENQRDDGTIELQVEAIKEFCSLNNYQLIKVFRDDGISGTKELEFRKGLIDLLEYLEKHREINTVVVFKLDRLARDLVIQEHIIKQFEKLNTILISTKEPDLNGNDPTRKFIRHILGATSEFEKSMIAMRMSAGRLKKAKRGGYAGGRIAFGYKTILLEKNINGVSKSDIQVDEKKTEIIRMIFEMANKRVGFRGIARVLNDNCLSAPNGSKWYAGTVKYILRNPIYSGTMKYRDIYIQRNELLILR